MGIPYRQSLEEIQWAHVLRSRLTRGMTYFGQNGRFHHDEPSRSGYEALTLH
jgi:hypothetical protein